MAHTTLHPRLLARRETLGQLLGLDDPTELAAALDDINTLLHRCGYHVAFAHDERLRHLHRRRGSSAVGGARARRGRPRGSANWASRQLGLGLATIWFELTGKAPTRRFDAIGDIGEHGPYRAFVACVLGMLPRRLRATRKGHVPEVDYLVRVSIDEFKSAQASSDEARQRGLLDEKSLARRPERRRRRPGRTLIAITTDGLRRSA